MNGAIIHINLGINNIRKSAGMTVRRTISISLCLSLVHGLIFVKFFFSYLNIPTHLTYWFLYVSIGTISLNFSPHLEQIANHPHTSSIHCDRIIFNRQMWAFIMHFNDFTWLQYRITLYYTWLDRNAQAFYSSAYCAFCIIWTRNRYYRLCDASAIYSFLLCNTGKGKGMPTYISDMEFFLYFQLT